MLADTAGRERARHNFWDCVMGTLECGSGISMLFCRMIAGEGKGREMVDYSSFHRYVLLFVLLIYINYKFTHLWFAGTTRRGTILMTRRAQQAWTASAATRSPGGTRRRRRSTKRTRRRRKRARRSGGAMRWRWPRGASPHLSYWHRQQVRNTNDICL